MEENKKEWKAPKLEELFIKNTKSGHMPAPVESGSWGSMLSPS